MCFIATILLSRNREWVQSSLDNEDKGTRILDFHSCVNTYLFIWRKCLYQDVGFNVIGVWPRKWLYKNVPKIDLSNIKLSISISCRKKNQWHFFITGFSITNLHLDSSRQLEQLWILWQSCSYYWLLVYWLYWFVSSEGLKIMPGGKSIKLLVERN
jgi:hypothetical protein